MNIGITRASSRDAQAVAAVKDAVWPENYTAAEEIAAVIEQTDHVTLIARFDDQPAGFVDGFTTLAQDGTRRWEVDLLAVHPAYTRRGVARALVTASTEAGRQMMATMARGLVEVSNIASQRTFAGCGYRPADEVCSLYIAAGLVVGDSAEAESLYTVAVRTLNYRGLWLEGAWSRAGFQVARHLCALQGLAIAGAIIPHSETQAAQWAQEADYQPVGDYQFWTRSLR